MHPLDQSKSIRTVALAAVCAAGLGFAMTHAAVPGGSGSAVRPTDKVPFPDPNDPLSSMVAVYTTPGSGMNIPEYVKMRVQQVADDTLPGDVVFPLANTSTDTVRTLASLHHNVVLRWLDPITPNNAADAPRFGANCDYIAYFGQGWDSDWSEGVIGAAPQYNGSGNVAWIWSNHEYISNNEPAENVAPTGQHLTFAKFLQGAGILNFDVTVDANWTVAASDTYIRHFKQQLGGSWSRIFRHPVTGEWRAYRDANARRYDATDNTLLKLVGHSLQEPDHDDSGNTLPDGVVVGVTGDCSGGQTPWGTVITAEENVQGYYGDLETAWTSSQRFIPGAGFDPGSIVTPTYAPSTSGDFGRISNPDERHNRDVYGYLAEIDPGDDPSNWYDNGDGDGHLKLGGMGRARWENATVAVGADWRLRDGHNIVIYGGDDRRSGRIWKWVSNGVYTEGMTKAQVRALLEEGTLWACHLAGLDNDSGWKLDATDAPSTDDDPGHGQWIQVSLDSTDIPPNAGALGQPTISVGEALQDVNYNGIGGFDSDDLVRQSLFTVANKLGIMELNRPEDIEWNWNDPSGTPRLYVAFTNHTRQVALNQDGVLYDPSDHPTDSPNRGDAWGSIFAIEEDDPMNPETTYTFDYWLVWKGVAGSGPYDAADPDNLMIDADGGVWFGTDGNFGQSGHADAVYYLDLDPAHKSGEPGVVTETYGLAFRVAAGPSDSEATGPALSSDQHTLFMNVQHPGESPANPSNWPQPR